MSCASQLAPSAVRVTALRDLDVLRQPVGAIEHVVPELVAAAALVRHVQLAVVRGECGTLVGLGVPALSDLEILRQPVHAIEHVVPDVGRTTAFVSHVQLAVVLGERRRFAGLRMAILRDLLVLRLPAVGIEPVVPDVVAVAPLVGGDQLIPEHRERRTVAGPGVAVVRNGNIGNDPARAVERGEPDARRWTGEEGVDQPTDEAADQSAQQRAEVSADDCAEWTAQIAADDSTDDSARDDSDAGTPRTAGIAEPEDGKYSGDEREGPIEQRAPGAPDSALGLDQARSLQRLDEGLRADGVRCRPWRPCAFAWQGAVGLGVDEIPQLSVAAASAVGEVIRFLLQLVVALGAAPGAAQPVRQVVSRPGTRDVAAARHALYLDGVHQFVRDRQEGVFRAGLVRADIDIDVGAWSARRHREALRAAGGSRHAFIKRDAREVEVGIEDLVAVQQARRQGKGRGHGIKIGFLNHLFYDRSHIAGPRELSIPFLIDKKPTVVPGGSAREWSGGARSVPYRAARSNSERAAPSACVGRRFWLLRSFGIDRLGAPTHGAGRGSVGPDG